MFSCNRRNCHHDSAALYAYLLRIERSRPMRLIRPLFLAAAVACAALGATAAQAQYYAPPPPPGYYHHHWHRGERYDGPREIVHHWDHYRLPPPPYGYVWIRDGHDFLLVRGDGLIARVIHY
jgi:hypothetical protein